MLRRPLHRSDANRGLIVDALRKAGVKVYDLGEPLDLLTGYRGILSLLEVKDGERKPSERRLRPSQQAFFDEWHGYPIFKVETVEEALAVHDIKVL